MIAAGRGPMASPRKPKPITAIEPAAHAKPMTTAEPTPLLAGMISCASTMTGGMSARLRHPATAANASINGDPAGSQKTNK